MTDVSGRNVSIDQSSKFCYYRVLHNYTPPNEYLNKGYLVIVEGDIIEVARPVELEHGTEENPDGWLKGKITKNNLEGYFPSGEYVHYIGKNPVQPTTPGTCVRRHLTRAIFFVTPILCSNCQDYIWGTGAVGVTCKDCGQCFHNECASDAVSFANCSKSPPARQPQIHNQQVPLSQWDIRNVAEWMAVVNLHRYAHIFMKHGKKGSDLSAINEAMLKEMKIEDEFHQKSILASIEKLCSNKKTVPRTLIAAEGASKNDHNFQVYSFSSMQACHLCSDYLWGIIQQGYQCRNCGLCCHRKCSVGNLPKCSSEKLKHLSRASFRLDAIFGTPLNEQFDILSGAEAPPIVIRFTRELEKRSQDRGIKVADAYRMPVSTAEVNRLKQHICEGNVEDANLDSFDHICIAGALKKFLRELPNAVIHEDFFQKFVQESEIEDVSQREKNLSSLADKLPLHHCKTLKFLLAHFTRCIKSQLGNEDAIKDAIEKLSRVFCQILIRPPWENIIEIVFGAETSFLVIFLLLQSHVRSVPQPEPISKPSDLQLYSGSVEAALWYWKDISKNELNERMSNTQDGTFLVRNSSDQVKDNYTLAVRKGGSNRLLKIYHREGKFGLMEPLVFPSIVALINYYAQNSLSHFNKTLDVELHSPVCRPLPIQPSQPADVQELRMSYLKADKEYNEEMKRYENLHDEHSQITEELQMRHQAHDAFRETFSIFEENLRIVMKNQRLVPQSEVAMARDNFELLNRRMKSVAENVVSLEAEIKQLVSKSKIRFKEMNDIKPELQSKAEIRDQLRQQLISCGEMPKMLNYLEALQDQNGNAIMEHVTSHSDSSTWLVNCDRDRAEGLLTGKPDGTFLIRPRDEPEWPYGLTIVKNGEMYHCKIGKKETGYGFADPFFIHETLSDLVIHYKDTSLVEHNDKLDVMLDFPVLGTVFEKPPSQIQKLTMMQAATANAPAAAPAVPRRTRRPNYELHVL